MSNTNSTERIHLSLNSDLISRLDSARERYGETRSNFARRALITYLDSLEAMQNMPELVKIGQEALRRSKGLDTPGQFSTVDLFPSERP